MSVFETLHRIAGITEDLSKREDLRFLLKEAFRQGKLALMTGWQDCPYKNQQLVGEWNRGYNSAP